MKVCLVDIGSTYTKVLLTDNGKIVGQAKSFTTVDDVNTGLNNALSFLHVKDEKILAASSANGGLKMIASGLVPELTAKAARFAALSAGAKLVKAYSYELSQSDIAEIEAIKPDIILLTGGTDGGNKKVIVNNAKALSLSKINVPIVVAGNKSASDEIKLLLKNKQTYFTENVMPNLEQLNIEPAQNIIRDIFLKTIIQAKGITKVSQLVSDILMPTPSAVLSAVKLLSEGTANNNGLGGGLGEILVIDMGGATTDIYSACKGMPVSADVIFRGLPEPYFKRTVEGDLGARYSLDSVLEIGSDLNTPYVQELLKNPQRLPMGSIEKQTEDLIASICVREAVKRASGVLRENYTVKGKVYIQEGKDLSNIKVILGTGGPIINSQNPRAILESALNKNDHLSLMPKGNIKFLLDKNYIMSSMGLLSMYDADTALKLLKENLVEI